MPCRNLCRLYIHLAFTYSVGPSSVVWSELGPATPFPPMRVLERQWVTGSQSRVWSGPKSQFTWGQSMQFQPLRTWRLGLITSHGFQVAWGRSVRSQPLRAWKLGLTTSLVVQDPRSQAWHGYLHGNSCWRWGEVRFETCVKSWVEQKARPNSQHKSHAFLC